MKRKVKPPKIYSVYCTYRPDNTFYIGVTSKQGKPLERYFGSNKAILEEIKNNPDHGFTKEIIATYDKISHAKAIEHILQWQYRNDPRCINQMWNVRLRLDHLTELVEPSWTPLQSNDHSDRK